MAHRPEPTKATERAEWNKEHARTKQKVVNAKREKLRNFDLTSALDNFVKTKDQPRKQPPPPEADNQFAENIGVNTNDEFGTLLKNAIKVLNKNPNDFNANVAMNGMNFLYNYENSKIAYDGTGAGDTYVNFKPGELDDEGQLVNTVDNNDGSLNNTDILDTTPNTEPNPISTEYQRPSPSERHQRRMEDILVRGRPLEKFKRDRERGRGTDVDDLFTKNRED
jgi:hypothetical protein